MCKISICNKADRQGDFKELLKFKKLSLMRLKKGYNMALIFNLKEVFNFYGWNNGFKFEIIFSNSGVARIYIGDRKTKYNANGYGYDKVSTVISNMINDLIGVQSYNKNIYGNSDGKLSYGVGFDSIKESFESVENYKQSRIYSGLNSSVYEVKFK